MRLLFVLALISIYVMACTPKPNRADVISLTSTAVITTPVCQPSIIQKSESGFPEIQGTMQSEGEVWALLFFDEAHAKDDLKTVWRITGEGLSFTAEAQHEDGTTTLPIWGPDFHESSTWKRPGKEWGTGFNFPKPGCWTLKVILGRTKGEIILNVLPAQHS